MINARQVPGDIAEKKEPFKPGPEIMQNVKSHINLFAIPAKNTWWIMKLTGEKDSYTKPVSIRTKTGTKKETILKIK